VTKKETKSLSSFTVIVAFLALAIVGAALVPLLPVKLNPSRNLPSLTVSFNMPDNAARVIESEVTSRLESMLARVQGVKEIKSTSSNGSGRITLGLDKHADIEMTRFEVSTVVRQAWAQLPEGVTYPQITTQQASDGRAQRAFMSYTINAPASPYEIQNYAEENIKPAIGQLSGIYKVDIYGAMPMEWKLEYDSDRLHSLGLTPADIVKAINENDQSQFLGIAEASDGEWLRVTSSTAADLTTFDPHAITVSTADGVLIPLSRLVNVTYEEATAQSYYRINGLNSIYVTIWAEEDANQLKLAEEVRARMETLRAHMPGGYQVSMRYDATEKIESELSKIYFRSGLTFVILLAFVALITLNLRYMMVITISLVINLAVAVIFYYLLGIEIQLYSLAGITISLNLIIDNIIVMTDHITHKRNLRAFTSVMAATLTTVGALGIVFFLKEEMRLNLQDFVAVVIVNLSVSLFVALFLVPALISKIGLRLRQSRHRYGKRFAVRFNRFYSRFIMFCTRHRVAMCVLLVLLFGLPLYLLPDKLKDDEPGAKIYNATIGNKTYKEKYRPWVDKLLGGSLRLFAKEVFEGSNFGRSEQDPEIYVYATLPTGATIGQMNELITKMESYLTTFPEISRFETSISSATRASLIISFTDKAMNSYFPYQLKSDIIAKAQTLGGGSWSVFGLQDNGFSNDVRESAGTYRVKMLGYNYDDLEIWADSLKNMLLGHRRIKEVNINSEVQWYKDDYTEFYLEIDKHRLAKENLTVYQLFSALKPIFGRDMRAGIIQAPGGAENILLHSAQAYDYDVWGLMNMPISIGTRTLKLADFATVQKRSASRSISKENQQYVLYLQYEYIGSGTQGRKILDADLEKLNAQLPLGYSAENGQNSYYWYGRDNGTSYWLLLLVIGIIFFTTSILFNSLSQPLAIIFTIPISFIGVFLIFYLTKINFDQGGFASFILLCGITVNASIYVLNEFNTLRARFPHRSKLSLYLRAWNTKILPIFLTVVSTILGFIPFMIGDGKESFWYPLALGTIGGLLMSLVGIFVYLPMFTGVAPRPPRRRKKSARPA